MMKITCVLLQSKLGEGYLSTVKSVHRASIAVKRALFFIKSYVWKNKISSSSFDCSDTRVIFIEGYVSTVKSVHQTSIAVKHALFLSNDTCGRIKDVYPASIAVKHALFSSKDTCQQ